MGELPFLSVGREQRSWLEAAGTGRGNKGVPPPEQGGGNASPAAPVTAHPSENQGGTV
ncbi:MAG: hypothetical protein MJ074_08570 [Oscillospiraceae bacterium]|nr:hypothetical protein [Oscillospiraceae bacterium]